MLFFTRYHFTINVHCTLEIQTQILISLELTPLFFLEQDYPPLLKDKKLGPILKVFLVLHYMYYNSQGNHNIFSEKAVKVRAKAIPILYNKTSCGLSN